MTLRRGRERAGLGDQRRGVAAELTRQPFARGDEAIEVDASVVTAALEQEHHILGGDVARGARCKGAATDPAEAGVDHGHPDLHGGQRVGEPGIAGVVEVRTEPDRARRAVQHLRSCGEAFSYLRWNCGTHGVGQRNLVRPGCGDAFDHVEDARERHLALVAATERGRERGAARNGRITSTNDHGRRGVDRRGRAHALIVFREGVGARDDHIHLGRMCRERAVETALVQHQPDIARPCIAGHRVEHRFGVGHLRHAFRVHEARDLDAIDARVDDATDQLGLLRGGEQHRIRLQTVARRDVDNVHAGPVHDTHSRGSGRAPQSWSRRSVLRRASSLSSIASRCSERRSLIGNSPR